MVRPTGLLKYFKARSARLLAAVIDQRFEGGYAIVLLGRRDIHVGHDENRAGRALGSRPRDLHATVQPIVDRADEMRPDLVAELLAVGGGSMCVKSLLVSPDRHDRKLIRRRHALEDLEAHIAIILAAGIGELPQKAGSCSAGRRRNVDIAHDIDG